MKKLILLLAVASLSLGMRAQDDMPVAPAERHSVATNSFWQNWFVQADVTWSAFYSHEPVLVAPFRKFPGGSSHTNLGLSLSLGKWFTPSIGLRTKLGAWKMGKEVDGVGGDNFWTLNEHVLFNISNMLYGYDEYRLWNLIPYAGAGVNHTSAVPGYGTQLSLGLLNTFRLSHHLAANLDLAWNNMDAGNRGLGLKRRSHQFSIEVGLTYNIGSKRWRRSVDGEAIKAMTEGELDALNAQLTDANNEIERLQSELAQTPKVAPPPVYQPSARMETKYVSAPVSIYFEAGKGLTIARRDHADLAALAELSKTQNMRLLVTGYADNKSGTAEGNLKMSQRRADAVADELVRLGVNRAMIDVVAGGGVDELSPAELNRRVTVELK